MQKPPQPKLNCKGKRMLRHLMYAAFAVMLGVAIMILPLMIFSHHVDFTKTGEPFGEAEKAFTTSDEERTESSIAIAQRYEILISRIVTFLPNALFIVVTGLVIATAVLLLAKRRLL